MTSFFVHRLCPLSLGDENGTLKEDFLTWSDQLISRLSHHQEKSGPQFLSVNQAQRQFA
jgi:hypothetical protein